MLVPESCTKCRSEAQKTLFLKRSWSDFDPQAYYLYGEDQNHETSFRDKALQAAVDSWCKIQVVIPQLKVTKQPFHCQDSVRLPAMWIAGLRGRFMRCGHAKNHEQNH
jgi:hypothetical protein